MVEVPGVKGLSVSIDYWEIEQKMLILAYARDATLDDQLLRAYTQSQLAAGVPLDKATDRFIAGLRADGLDFRGMLFPGLMITRSGPKVLEFNCRFGDPETEVLLPRLRSDLLEICDAVAHSRLAEVPVEWSADGDRNTGHSAEPEQLFW
mgnify:CR=1 FL=1